MMMNVTNNRADGVGLFQPLRDYIHKDRMNRRNLIIYALFGILLLSAGIYAPSLNNDFVNFDDNYLIVNNEDIRDINANTLSKFFKFQYYGHYHPLTMLSLAIDYQISELNPKSYHITNLIFHLLTIIFLFLFIQKLTERADVSLLVTLLFAIHPLQTESVAWLGARSSVMFTCFYLASLYLYLLYLKNNLKRKYLILSLVLFVFSLLSKSSAVTLPVVLFLLDYYTGRKLKWNWLVEKIPFFLFSLFWGLLAVLSAKAIGSINITLGDYTFLDRVLFVFYSLFFYINKLFVPIHQSAIHYEPLKSNGILPFLFYIYPVLFLILIAAVFIFRKFRRELIFGLFFYLITISLVIRIIPIGATIVCERYFYLPSIGIFFIIAMIYLRLMNHPSGTVRKYGDIMAVFLVAVSLVFSFATYKRSMVWKDGLSLFTDAINKYPDRSYAYYGRANVKVNLGDYNGALDDYTLSVETEPFFLFYMNRGNLYLKMKNYRKAIDDYTKGIQMNPVYYDLYAHRGAVYGILKEYSNALNDYSIVIKNKPKHPDAYYNRGVIYSLLNDYKAAENDYTYAIRMGYKYADPWFNRGNVRKKMNNVSAACKDWKKALEMGEKKAGLMLYKYCRSKEEIAMDSVKRAMQIAQQQDVPVKTETKDKIVTVNNKEKSLIIEDKKEGTKNKVIAVEEEVNGKKVKKLKRFNEKGVLVEEGMINNKGKYDGEFKMYYDNGQLKLTGFFNDSIYSGKWKEYYENGNVKEEYAFEKGTKHGSQKIYYTGGQLWTERIYRQGKIWEVMSNFNPQGNPQNPGTLKNGNGILNIYDDKGKLVKQAKYNNGTEVK